MNITAYETNIDNNQREKWMEKRWPELCADMAAQAVTEVRGDLPVGTQGGIADMLEDSNALAEFCYQAETGSADNE